ncbi:hypothetical protein A2U01_0059098 [Trifolium medium]|uniref:Uncharacterized protein n=1 Tax=Trifolium medium TaxID=97028 RepID=A0A392RML1_9FABA|nr:hypothetical protein [Trifolium medium]
MFEGEHAADIATPSVQQSSGSLTRKQMIAELQDVSSDLGEKKSKIDRVIQDLMLEEGADVAESEQEEKEDGDAGRADAGSESDEVEDSDESPTI